MQPVQHINASLAGLFAFSVFFVTMFNGMGYWIYIAALVALALNTLISGFMALASIRQGLLTAAAYSAPVAVFSALAVGDLVLKGKGAPFVFWFSAAVASFAAGAAGVLLVYLYRLIKPKP